ncbi:MAG: hypothetical protein PHI06_08550 [Desulfobulbaceae bacterium]|nr:hypothetical protein [Desulfobulbaceae bacterium]
MNSYKTEQEQFWAGGFGNDYIDRNSKELCLSGRIALLSQVLACARPIDSAIEFGANIGNNILALKQLIPKATLSAIEINGKAVEILRKIDGLTVYHQSILDFKPDYPRDLAFSTGVLIHIEPSMLPQVYDMLFQSSKRYICLTEYYNPVPVELSYRGYEQKLFKRDFAGEMLDRFPELELVNYGFCYHRDNNFPLDDATWFLLEKR